MPGPTPDDTPDLRAWIGRTQTVVDALAAEQSLAAAACFDLDPAHHGAGSTLPVPWHWFHFLPRAPQGALGDDGHPRLGGFMPPVPYPRRMFAGSRITVHRPLVVGTPAERTGTIRDVVLKHGRSGALAFVTVGYRIVQDGALALEEEQDIVYREPGAPVAAPVARPLEPVAHGTWSRVVTADTRLLFRFSALTFNAHRIHYDRDYARDVEGYPGLVVHGPLTAMLLLDLVRRHTARPVVAFAFRGQAPLFDGAPLRLVGRPDGDRVALEAQGPDGVPALSAEARLG
jgi:3-methylfumaryl-CoA hydratase